MANLGTTFDATNVEPAKPLEVLPPGKYPGADRQQRDARHQGRHGPVSVARARCAGGPYQGRKLFDRLNLVNANPQTVEIAQRTLSAICHATGRMQVQDSEELHLIPLDRRRPGPAAEERLRRKQQGALPAARARHEAGTAAAGAPRSSAAGPTGSPGRGVHIGALEASGVR